MASEPHAPLRSCGVCDSSGRTADQAAAILEDALALQSAGAFSSSDPPLSATYLFQKPALKFLRTVVLECIPDRVATFITQQLCVPTIGIGSGNGCSGQVPVAPFSLERFICTFFAASADDEECSYTKGVGMG